MTTCTLDHLHLICEDLEEMIRFWRDGIGASFIEYRTFGGAQGAVLLLGGLHLYLRVPKENERGKLTAMPSLGYDHLGLWVDDLEAACTRMETFGCRINSGPTDLHDRRILFLAGPEGITLELMQRFARPA